MRVILTSLCLLALAGAAFAGQPPIDQVSTRTAVPCDLTVVTYDWDFAVSDQGFVGGVCEAGGTAVWEYGATTYVPGAPGNVWGTVLNGDYVSDSGGGLTSPAFTVDANSNLVEIHHYYDIENNYDGGNVKANGQVIVPVGGYDAVISTSTYYYAWCVDNQEGFTDDSGMAWVIDCFDLSAYVGQSVELDFEFGSDSSVQYPGWYLAYVKVGTDLPSPTQESTWGQIKSLF